MREQGLRRLLLDLSDRDWDALLEAEPSLRGVFAPELARSSRKPQIDGRSIRRWVEQPQHHVGRLVATAEHSARRLLGLSQDDEIDWEAADGSVTDPPSRRLLRAIALADGREFGDVTLGGSALDSPSSSEVDLEPPAERGWDDPVTGRSNERGDEIDPDLSTLRDRAKRLAERLDEAASAVRAGQAFLDLEKQLTEWNRSRAETMTLLELPDDVLIGFDELQARLQERAELRAENGRRLVERERLDARRHQLIEQRDGYLLELAQVEQLAASASEITRAVLEQGATGLKRAIEDVDAALDLINLDIVGLDDRSAPPTTDVGPEGAEKESAKDGEQLLPGRQSKAVTDSAVPIQAAVVADGDDSTSDALPPGQAENLKHPARTPEPDPSLAHIPVDHEEPVANESSHVAAEFEDSTPQSTVYFDTSGLASAGAPGVRDSEEAVQNSAARTALVSSGRFAAAYWLEIAEHGDSVTAAALRVASAAFASGPGGVEPTEVLIACTSDFDAADFAESPDAAGLVAVAMARSGLVAAWIPWAEFTAAVALLRLPAAAHDLLIAAGEAARDSYRHSAVGTCDAGEAQASIGERARTTAYELSQAKTAYHRATRALHHLAKPHEALGSALEIVAEWADGGADQAALLEAATRLSDNRSVSRAIDDADRHIASATVRQPIVATARGQLIRYFEQVAEIVREAIATDADAQVSGGSTAQRSEELRRLASNAAGLYPAGIVEAAFEQLRAWVLAPASSAGVPGINDVLARASLPIIGASRDGDGMPVLAGLSPIHVREQLTTPLPPTQLYRDYCERGDLRSASLLPVAARSGAKPLDEVQSDWSWRTSDRARKLTERLTKLPLVVHLDDAGRAMTEGQLKAAASADTDRFDILSRDLDGIEAQLDGLQNEAAQQLRDELGALRVDGDELRRVQAVIDAGDLTTAEQFLHFLRAGDDLPSTSIDDLDLLEEFGSVWRSNESASLPFDDLCKEFGAVPSGVAAQGIAGWKSLTSRGNEQARALQSVLRLVGLETFTLPNVENERTRLGVTTFVAREARPTDGSIVPELGSRANHRYVVRVATSQLDARALVEAIPDAKRREANIVLYRGRLVGRQRTELITASRKSNSQVLVLDDLAIAFLARRAPGSWQATQKITLPFSSFSHYRPYVAGDVPDEVFVGRQRERDEISSPEGGLFVYGGRQLGKSALLRRVQRDFGRNDDAVAIYIDLKARGIGEFNEPEYLWTVLLEELQHANVLSTKLSAARPDALSSHIRSWLMENEHRRILLLLDEADLFLEQEAAEHEVKGRRVRFPNISVIKGLMDQTGRRFKPVFAGLHQVQRFQNISNSPLAHGGRDMLIGPLHQAEARRLVVVPLAALGYRFENPDLVWRLIAATNYQAGLVQIVCFALIEHMRRKAPNALLEPPFVIAEHDVDTVIDSAQVRDQIAQRFQLTIRLEDRYFVIALVVATLCLDDGFREQYTPEVIRDWCREYWPGGFDPQRLSIEQFRTYLDEMVGLGVLVVRNDGLYTVRSPSIVQMLGQSPEQQLIDRAHTFALPHEYNPRAARRAIGQSGEGRRSPLTEQDFATVFKENIANGVVVISGTAALGMPRVWEALQSVAQDGTRDRVVTVTRDVGEASRRGSGQADRRPIIVLDAQSIPDDEIAAAVDSMINMVNRQAQERRVVLLSPSAARRLTASVSRVTLRRWDEESLRGWNDLPFGTPEERDALLESTGGWPALVERAVLQANSGSAFPAVMQESSEFPKDSAEATQFLLDVGVERDDLAHLQAWCELTEPTDFNDIGSIAELLDVSLNEFAAAIRRLVEIGVVVERDDTYAIEKVVHRALQKAR